MKRSLVCFVFAVAFLGLQQFAGAQEVVVPAGTMLHCVLDEANLSSATVEVGDPVLCHLYGVQQFGHSVFPRGSYLAGHLEADKEPGHFVGKGWLKLQFDRIGLPNTDVPAPTKITSVRGYRVDREGKIIGKGHAKRDAIEWMFPPLWPWKVISLPFRGPRPTLKGETAITLRLMEDVAIPQAVASPWRHFGQPSAESFTPPRNVPAVWHASATPTAVNASAVLPMAPAAAAPAPQTERLTLFVLKTDLIYGATDYWLDNNGRLNYVLASGNTASVDLSEVDWSRTTQLNSERGVTVTLRSGRQVF